MCFADTREIRVDIQQGTVDTLVAEIVSANDSGGRYYGIGDSAAPQISGPRPFLQVAVPQPFPDGWRITRLVAKARGSDASWEGRVTVRTQEPDGFPAVGDVVPGGFVCELSGANGGVYDVCEVEGDYPLYNMQLLGLHALSTKETGTSDLTRVSGCITIEPPLEEEVVVQAESLTVLRPTLD